MGTPAYPNRKPIGSSRDRYERIQVLGEGGMGVVWRGRDLKTGSDVAIKVMKDLYDSASVELFKKESDALTKLSHPNIVDIRDIDVLNEDGQEKPFFVMPLLTGKTLAELIRESSERLTTPRVVEIITHVCRGLHAAHAQGMIHRDIKPSNIFVLNDDTVKIIDFGVVYLTGTRSIAGQKGTLQYMSPEQLLGKEVSPASDLFSLGAVLYESLTGRNPFTHHTREETSDAVLNSMPQPVSELNPAISHGIAQVVHKCLAKRPINRFSSARELADTLNKALRNEPVFDISKLRDRLDRVKSAISNDLNYASELLTALESEGHLAPEITFLRNQIEAATRQKRIEQLFSIAQASIERDDELEFGLAKLRDLLELDPNHPQALLLKATAEKKRSEGQAGRLIEIGNAHLSVCEFSEARRAAKEVLANRPTDPRAMELLRKVDEMESIAKRVRETKEQLYDKALRDFQNGEVESARSRLDHLFSEVRLHPEGAVPERDAVYARFYEEVSSACDSLRSRHEEALKLLEAENFSQAQAICVEQLAMYPSNEDFHALKIQIEYAERQKISADFAIATKNAEAEPDLDRRANIWHEAMKSHPQEARFAEQWKFTCDRRDLVNSIVNKADQLSESGQYTEALSQWEKLKRLYPGYPGLSFELEQCRKKRDQQVRSEEKARLAEEIVSIMKSSRDFERALRQIRAALLEYPGDTEFSSLERICQETLARAQESNRLFEEGQAAKDANNPAQAIELLKRALEIDRQNSAAQDVLIRVLTDEARACLNSDLAAAEQFFQEASTLNSNHQLVRSLGMELAQARRQKYVSECLIEARGLDAVGNTMAAFEKIREARKRHPDDVRLQQFHDSLLKANPELQLQIQRQEWLNAACDRLEHDRDFRQAQEVHRVAQAWSAENPSDPDSLKCIARADDTLHKVLSPEDLKKLHNPDTALQESKPGQNYRSVSAQVDQVGSRRLFPRKADTQQVPSPAAKPEWWIRARNEAADVWRRTTSSVRTMDVRSRRIALGIAGGLVVVVFTLFVLKAVHDRQPILKTKTELTSTPDTHVHVVPTPPDSVLKIDGAIHGADFNFPHGKTQMVEVSRPGYQSQTIKVGEKPGDLPVSLIPWPVRLSVTTAVNSGYLELDGNDAGQINNGSIDVDVPADGGKHRIAVVAGSQRFMELEFQSNPGERPTLTPIQNPALIKEMLIASGMGPTATIYAGPMVKNAEFGGREVNPDISGFDVTQISDQNSELTYTYRGQYGSLTLSATEWPSLVVRSLGAGAEILITSNVDTATLTANGNPVPRRGHGWRITEPNSYTFVLSANGFETQTWTATLKPLQSLREVRSLKSESPTSVLSALEVSDSTDGASVEVDGKQVGTVGADGSARFAAILAEGNHRVQFTKEGFCVSRTTDVVASPPADIRVTGVRLDPCASIRLQPTSKPALVKIFPSGDPNGRWIELTAGKSIPVPAGTYNVAVESPGFAYQTGIRLEAGHNLDFTPLLKTTQECQLRKPGDVTSNGDWMKLRNSGGYVYFSSGCVNMHLSFRKPSGLIGKKKVEWAMIAGGGTGQIEWSLEGGRIHRKTTVGEHSFDQLNTNVQNLIGESNATYNIRLVVDGQHIKILTDNNAVLDDYEAQDPGLHDLSSGNVGVRTPAEFKFSGGSNE
jgi:serine/threonine-protein kinase